MTEFAPPYRVRRKDLIRLAAIAGVCLVLVSLGAFAYRWRDARMEEVDLARKLQSGAVAVVRPYNRVLGPPDAKVTLVEFIDPQCPTCREVQPLIKRLLLARHGKIRLVVRYLTLHPHSLYAAAAVEAAGRQGRYWEMLERLFENQKEWGNVAHPQPDLIAGYARALGLDMDAWQRAVGDATVRRNIETDHADAHALAIWSIPAFFVNGRKFKNRLDLSALEKMIDAHLQP